MANWRLGMWRVNHSVDQQVLGIGFASDLASWTDVLVHASDFLPSREPICDHLGNGAMWHAKLPPLARRDFAGSLDVFLELATLRPIPIGSPIEKLSQRRLGNPFERTRHG
jgi:hypothetical protein